MAHLNLVADWYHQAQAGNRWLLQPSDAFYWNNQRILANNVFKSAFAAAQAVDILIAHHAASPAATANARETRLSAHLATNNDELDKLRNQRADLDAKIKAATDADRSSLLSQREVIQAEIDLDSALAQSLEKASALLAGSPAENNAASMAGQIAALKRSVPEVFDANTNAQTKDQAPPVINAVISEGLVNRLVAIFSLVRSRHAMDNLIARTGGTIDRSGGTGGRAGQDRERSGPAPGSFCRAPAIAAGVDGVGTQQHQSRGVAEILHDPDRWDSVDIVHAGGLAGRGAGLPGGDF